MSKHFISYSSADAEEFALRLRDELEAGPPPIPVWLDKRDIESGRDWDVEIDEALKVCRSFLFVMTRDSVEDESVCKREWTRALSYKKPIVPLKLHPDAGMPFRLDPRQHIDFTRWLESPEEFDSALARENSDRQGEGAWLGNIGICHNAVGQTEQASDYFEQSLAIGREVGDRKSEAAHPRIWC